MMHTAQERISSSAEIEKAGGGGARPRAACPAACGKAVQGRLPVRSKHTTGSHLSRTVSRTNPQERTIRTHGLL